MKPTLIEIICKFDFAKIQPGSTAYAAPQPRHPTFVIVAASAIVLGSSCHMTFAKQQPGDIARPAEIMVARQCAYQAVKHLDTPVMPVAQLTKAIIQTCRPEILAALDEMEARPEVSNTDVARFRRNDLDNPDLDALIGQLIAVFREELPHLLNINPGE